MSVMAGNPHFNAARSTGEGYKGYTMPSDAEVIALAQIEATLALAYEQRTANLLAFERAMIETRLAGHITGAGRALWAKASEESIERLGLA